MWPDSTTTYFLLIDDTVGDYSCAVREDTVTVFVGSRILGIPLISLIFDTLFADVGEDTLGLTYHWYFEDSLIVGTDDFFFVPDKEGEYFVEVFDSFGCGSGLSEGFVFMVDGVFDVQMCGFGDVQIYPNPAREEFRLTINDFRFANYTLPFNLLLFDVFGRVVLEQLVSSNHSVVSVSLLEVGVYYWVVSPFDNEIASSAALPRNDSWFGGKVLVLR